MVAYFNTALIGKERFYNDTEIKSYRFSNSPWRHLLAINPAHNSVQ